MSRTDWEATLILPVSADRDHISGPVDAPLTLVEYGDFECPHCGAAHGVVRQLLADAGDSLRLVFRHFPITTIHPRARPAAEAAEAAGAQGQFWAMHDTLFENQDRLGDSDLLAYAATLGLDVERFAGELASHAHAPRIREDFMSGVRSGVNGTPTFYVNGVRHDGGWDLESLTAALRSAASA
jgi:protein-disulfide isomerase